MITTKKASLKVKKSLKILKKLHLTECQTIETVSFLVGILCVCVCVCIYTSRLWTVLQNLHNNRDCR